MLGLSPAYIAQGARGALPSAQAAVMFTGALAAVAAGTAWARIHVGVHFPRDIAAGMLLACVIAGVLSATTYLCRRFFAAFVGRDGSKPKPNLDWATPQQFHECLCEGAVVQWAGDLDAIERPFANTASFRTFQQKGGAVLQPKHIHLRRGHGPSNWRMRDVISTCPASPSWSSRLTAA